ncbi:MAG: OmpA family protein [Alphaproteobacteria bacterium]|nr:OmpA family protein [Alphaproteobacteria bacterium]
MQFFASFRGPRRLASLSLLCAGLVLAGCMGDEDVIASGSPFSQALFRNYTDLAAQAAAAPAPQAMENSGGFFSDIANIFSSAPANPADAVVDAFREKAGRAAAGEEPAPEPAPNDATIQGVRARLVRAIAQGKDGFPDQAARAQADYDCWVMERGAANLAGDAQACRTAFSQSLVALENAGRPAPARPAPVAAAPIAPPPAPADYTVYFDLDSWTLTAEDLAVITNVINTARTGGQSRITVVGHTDTSGSAAHNQRLSVHRANVVKEALVDMGARREAVQVSGVGESDLAVPTEDGVKEAKNRRAVIGILP